MGFFDDLGSFLFGSDPQMQQVSLQTPEQQRAMKGYFNNPINNTPLYGAGQNWIQSILSNDPEAFRAFEAPYMQQFEQEIIPQIAERFGGMGNVKASSGLNQSLAQAAKGLSTNLAGLRANLQQGAVNQGLQYAQQPYSNTLAGLGIRSFENVQTPGQEGFLAPALGALGSAAAGPLGGAFGNFLGSKMFGAGNLPMNRPTAGF